MTDIKKYYKMLKNNDFKVSEDMEKETMVSFQYIIDELIKLYKKDNLILVRLVTTHVYQTMYNNDDEYYVINYLLMNKDTANKYITLHPNNDEDGVIKLESKEFYPTEEIKRIEKEIIDSSKFVIKNKYIIPTGSYTRKYIKYKFSNYNLDEISLFSQYGSPTFITSSNIENEKLIEITLKLLEKIKYNQLQEYNNELYLLKLIRNKIIDTKILSAKEQKKLISLLNNEGEAIKANQNLLSYTLKKIK